MFVVKVFLLTHNFFVFISVNLEESEFLIATGSHEHSTRWMELNSCEKEK
jgi:hypothetical protein